MNINTINKRFEITDSNVATNMAGQPIVTREDNKLINLVKSFSWFSLSEVSHSTLFGLQGYYGRVIMNEINQPNPRQDKIDYWHAQIAKLAAIERDGNNFMTREKMEKIIIKYAPIFKLTS